MKKIQSKRKQRSGKQTCVPNNALKKMQPQQNERNDEFDLTSIFEQNHASGNMDFNQTQPFESHPSTHVSSSGYYRFILMSFVIHVFAFDAFESCVTGFICYPSFIPQS